jgi:MFS family permease
VSSCCCAAAAGIDVSWIISLMSSLTPSQTVLALAMINMTANFGGFVGNYVIGALKQASGNYYGAVWMMGSIMVLAAGLVTLFPMSWVLPTAEREAERVQHKGDSMDGVEEVDLDLGVKHLERDGEGKW